MTAFSYYSCSIAMPTHLLGFTEIECQLKILRLSIIFTNIFTLLYISVVLRIYNSFKRMHTFKSTPLESEGDDLSPNPLSCVFYFIFYLLLLFFTFERQRYESQSHNHVLD